MENHLVKAHNWKTVTLECCLCLTTLDADAEKHFQQVHAGQMPSAHLKDSAVKRDEAFGKRSESVRKAFRKRVRNQNARKCRT